MMHPIDTLWIPQQHMPKKGHPRDRRTAEHRNRRAETAVLQGTQSLEKEQLQLASKLRQLENGRRPVGRNGITVEPWDVDPRRVPQQGIEQQPPGDPKDPRHTQMGG